MIMSILGNLIRIQQIICNICKIKGLRKLLNPKTSSIKYILI
uniref:Uncharacterized protein n=1 Tax=Anguilla anguilla TaxID=7936 RepID=A0A0E9XS42_ANGAN